MWLTVKMEAQVKKEMQSYYCDYAIKKNACGAQPPVTCDICHVVYHMSCAKLRFPPKFGFWAHESCVSEMIGSRWTIYMCLHAPCSMFVQSLHEVL